MLVVNSAHLASPISPDTDRWLPIFWAIDEFKSSQAANVREGNWRLPPVDEAAVPGSDRAKAAFIEAMDKWDESAADAAVAGLARTASLDELFDLFARYGARDFREIGHKGIYVSNSFRCLEVIGWQHAEPVLRSLAFALLDRGGAKENPAKADFSEDRPYRTNVEAVKSDLRAGWLDGKPARRRPSVAMLEAISHRRRRKTPARLGDQAAQRRRGFPIDLRRPLQRRGRIAHAGPRHPFAPRHDFHQCRALRLAAGQVRRNPPAAARAKRRLHALLSRKSLGQRAAHRRFGTACAQRLRAMRLIAEIFADASTDRLDGRAQNARLFARESQPDSLCPKRRAVSSSSRAATRTITNSARRCWKITSG